MSNLKKILRNIRMNLEIFLMVPLVVPRLPFIALGFLWRCATLGFSEGCRFCESADSWIDRSMIEVNKLDDSWLGKPEDPRESCGNCQHERSGCPYHDSDEWMRENIDEDGEYIGGGE